MPIAALLLAVVANSCDRGSTYDIRACWSSADDVAAAELGAAYATAKDELRVLGINPAPLAAAQGAWATARDAGCSFEYELYLPGTIAPQLGVECDVRMTHARTQRLAALTAALKAHGRTPAERPVSATAGAQLDRFYRLYQEQLTTTQQSKLAQAENAWITYRDRACAIEGGACLTDLENERIAELKAGWLGEAFW